jgi:hypothetical protein
MSIETNEISVIVVFAEVNVLMYVDNTEVNFSASYLMPRPII